MTRKFVFYIIAYRCLQGASLCEILQAGEWKSPAFLAYLDLHALDRDAAAEALLTVHEESDNEIPDHNL